MKYLLALAGLAMFQFASAQTDDFTNFQKQFQRPLLLKKTVALPRFNALPHGNVQPDKRLPTLTKGIEVYSLPQDHMPCLVPSMEAHNMPNAGKDMKIPDGPGSMPNATTPLIVHREWKRLNLPPGAYK